MGRAIRKTEGTQRLRLHLDALANMTGKVGFFESAKYADGTPVAYVATIQEFGDGQIPPRPFMRPTIAERSNEWTRQFGGGAASVARGEVSPSQVMDAVCAMAAGDVRKTISQVSEPPLADSTVAARKRRYADKGTTGNLTKPLVDTAIMVNSVTHMVTTGGEG